MKKIPFLACSAACVLVITITAAMLLHAQEPAAPRWYKGNLHTHSLWSDGDDFPEMIADWYAGHGYHFLALSDHNILSNVDKWMKLRDINVRGGPLALGKCQKRFGEDWVEQRGEGDKREVRLKTLDQFRKLIEKPGSFIMIQGEEITDKFGTLPIHMNATNIQELIKPKGGKSVREVMENNLKQVMDQSERTGKPILQHLNHPNFVWGVTAEDIAAVVFERFFEIHNGHPGVNQLGDGIHEGIERMWDIVNTLRIAKMKAPPLYGVANDDSHNYHGTKPSMAKAETGRGWVMVRSGRLDAESLIAAMVQGDFYASSGVTLGDVRFEDGTITITIEPDGDAQFTTRFVGTPRNYDDSNEPVLNTDGSALSVTRRYSPDVGKTFAEATGTTARYKLTGDELYVRAIITSNKPAANPSYKGQMRQAWTQPVGWEKWIESK
jgi:hypothetical protein